MPVSSTIQRGNMLFDTIIGVTTTPPNALATVSTSTVTVTVPGVQLGDLIGAVNFQVALPNLLVLVNAWVSAANTISLQYTNSSASSSGASSATNVILEICRPENYLEGGFSQLPNSIF